MKASAVASERCHLEATMRKKWRFRAPSPAAVAAGTSCRVTALRRTSPIAVPSLRSACATMEVAKRKRAKAATSLGTYRSTQVITRLARWLTTRDRRWRASAKRSIAMRKTTCLKRRSTRSNTLKSALAGPNTTKMTRMLARVCKTRMPRVPLGTFATSLTSLNKRVASVVRSKSLIKISWREKSVFTQLKPMLRLKRPNHRQSKRLWLTKNKRSALLKSSPN